MQNFKKFIFDYIETLYENNNLWLDDDVKNRFSREEFYELLKPVINIIIDNKDSSYEEIREKIIDISLLDESILSLIKSGITPGIGFAASTLDTDLYIYSGFYDDKKSLMNMGTIFDIASITKMYTSLFFIILSSKYKLFSLDDKVTKYAPVFKNLSNVSINDLLTFNVPLITDGRIDDENISRDEAFSRLFNIRVDENKQISNPNYSPYTDMGYIVLKYVIEYATGYSYSSLIQFFILNEVGAKNTYFNVPDFKKHLISPTNNYHYITSDGYLINKKYDDIYLPSDGKARKLYDKNGSAHAGVFSTVKDVNLLSKKLACDKFLNSLELKDLLTNYTGRKYNLNGNIKYRTYFGKGVYLAHPLNAGEIISCQSGAASAGWTGTYTSFDPFNHISMAFAGNKTFGLARVFNKDVLIKNEIGQVGIYDKDNKFLVDSSHFAWEKEKIVKSGYALMLRLKFYEDYVKQTEPNFDRHSLLIRHL